jgi:transposase-like protein
MYSVRIREGGIMNKKRYTPEQIISILRKAEVELAQSQKTIAVVCRGLEITEQTYYRWRKLYGGMKVSQARRLKELEKENSRLKQAVADLTIDKLILKEALEGNY